MERAPLPRPRAIAVILAGAVTKGAFEAGVLQVLAERGIAVKRIVAASSGALNGAAYAAGVRAHRERAAAAEIVDVWQRRGGWRDVLHFDLCNILRLRGISDQKKLHAILRDSIPPSTSADPAPIELHMIVAPLCGCEAPAGAEPSTTYTRMLSFDGASFDTRDRLDQVLVAATASAALPVLFVPVDLPGLGPCVDGGLVANTPIRYAFGRDAGATIDAVVVVAGTPAFLGPPRREYRGGELIAHVVDMLFSEWLYQDLRRSHAINARLYAIAELARQKGWSPAEIEGIREALGWEWRHVVPIISIRPVTPLPGTLLSGFLDPAIRRAYVAVGVERARDVLDRLGWS